MTAQELWREGRLGEAVEAQVAEVRAHPGDADRRYFLFALLCLAGDLEKASRQLDALGVGDPALQGTAVVYRNLLASERERRASFEGSSRPVTPPGAAPTLLRRVDAIAALARGDVDGVGRLLVAAAGEEAPVAGTCDGTPFPALTDTDDLLGPSLEVFAGGRYILLPFASLRRLEVEEPSHLLDLLWIPARLETDEGTEAEVHLPVLYAGTHEAEASEIRLGRGTEWYEAGAAVRGRGQKVLALGGDGADEDRALLSIRVLEIAGGSRERA
jgi:type VI secretion system protein ImpE